MFKMVDVCAGKMKIGEVLQEIIHYMAKSPERLIIDIQLGKDGYQTTLWITKKDFRNKC